jgi:putative ATPase
MATGARCLNLIEQVFAWTLAQPLDRAALAARLMRRAAKYDKSGEEHYNLISALHKSVRGSDPDAALYWFARMLEGGEDPRFLARRITRMAVEDIGLADPQAQAVCLQGWETYERLGARGRTGAGAGGDLSGPRAQSRTRATWPTRRRGQPRARQARNRRQTHPQRADRLMKDIGYGAGYAYDHDAEDGFSGRTTSPMGMKRPVWYQPPERGFERELKKRVDYFAKLRDQAAGRLTRYFSAKTAPGCCRTRPGLRLTLRPAGTGGAMIGTLLQVALGGAIGCFARYLTHVAVLRGIGPGFPVGNVIVNVVGSFLMGVLVVWLAA